MNAADGGNVSVNVLIMIFSWLIYPSEFKPSPDLNIDRTFASWINIVVERSF